MDKPSLTERPPNGRPVTAKKKCVPGCNHKYEILEYPGVHSAGYLFYCIFCLDFQERTFKQCH